MSLTVATMALSPCFSESTTCRGPAICVGQRSQSRPRFCSRTLMLMLPFSTTSASIDTARPSVAGATLMFPTAEGGSHTMATSLGTTDCGLLYMSNPRMVKERASMPEEAPGMPSTWQAAAWSCAGATAKSTWESLIMSAPSVASSLCSPASVILNVPTSLH